MAGLARRELADDVREMSRRDRADGREAMSRGEVIIAVLEALLILWVVGWFVLTDDR
jgi:hypothetical protein